MQEYFEIVKNALNAISEDYYKLRTTYNPNGIVRERVFCYELYHQMRCLMPADYPLYIHGEINKRGHDDIAYQRDPDFVFHSPGNFKDNKLVIEVKGSLENEGIKKDFKTLFEFVENVSYEKGLFILYNHCFAQLKNRICEDIKDLQRAYKPSTIKAVSIITKSNFQEEPQEYSISQLFE